MHAAEEALPRTCALLEQGRQSVLHPGAQLYVSLRNEVVADFALGESRPGVAMQPDTLTLWLSSGKPLTVIAIAQLVDGGRLTFDDPVSRHLPEFAQGGKESITLRHLLTHTAGFRGADQLPENLSWDETIAGICATPAEPDWVPGAKAGYQLTSSWFILGELVRRLAGRPLNQYVRENILEPAGLNDSWLGLPRERARAYGERMGLMYLSGRAEFRLHPLWNREEDFVACRPGSGARGPIRELGKLYETLLNIAASAQQQPGAALVRPETLRELVSPQRVGLFDHTFQHTLDLGLGFILNSNRYGPDTVPYGYGRHASERAFGHSGSQSSCAFADSEHQLVVAWHCNGQPGEPRHQKRAREINSAIYEDLNIA
jgi:CubicO group peptidase (beta-lactamase class C family)